MNGQVPLDFLLQAEDLVARLDADIALLCHTSTDDLPHNRLHATRRRIVEQLFRSTHTLKGSAAIFEDALIARLAHEIENTLHALRLASRARLPAALGEALQAAVDTISLHLRDQVGEVASAAVAHATERSDEAAAEATAAIVAQLRSCARELQATNERQEDESEAEHSVKDSLREMLPAEWRDAPLDLATLAHLGDAAQGDLPIFNLTISFDLETFEQDYRSCEAALSERGEIIANRPLLFADDSTTGKQQMPPRIEFHLLYAAALEASDIELMLATYETVVTPLPRCCAADTYDSPSTDFRQSPDESGAQAQLVRVSLDELDEMIHSIAELQEQTRIALSKTFAVSNEAATSDFTVNDSTTGVSAANTLAMDDAAMKDALRGGFLLAQEKLLRLRMTSIEPRLQEAARAGRVAARTIGKEIDWEIAGGDVQLDASLAERLSTPLLHLVRNAVDHGIESFDERRATGKAARGKISLRAETRDGRVRVIVRDDGRGIEPERVRAAAIARRIISPARELKASDYLRLIFRPGFTTAELSDGTNGIAAVSGRGVGLDAAERGVREAGGELRVSSTPGQGTTFEMRLPLTLALMRAWIVRSGSYHYCISAEHVREAIRFDSTQITQLTDELRLSWRNATVPLIPLSSLLANDAKHVSPAAIKRNEKLSALILDITAGDSDRVRSDAGDSANCAALLVDGWEPPDELLVRGLGGHAPQWHGVAGATARADGGVALLLDIAELMEAQGKD